MSYDYFEFAVRLVLVELLIIVISRFPTLRRLPIQKTFQLILKTAFVVAPFAFGLAAFLAVAIAGLTGMPMGPTWDQLDRKFIATVIGIHAGITLTIAWKIATSMLHTQKVGEESEFIRR